MPRNSLPPWSAWAVRPAAAGEPAVACNETSLYGQPGLSVLRRPANHRASRKGEGNASSPFVPTSAHSSQVGRVRFPLKPMTVERIIICITGSNRGINATVVRGHAPSSALRSTAAPGPQVGRAPAIARAARRCAAWLAQQYRPPPQCGLTLPSRGRPQASFACLRPPLMSNVRAHA